MDRLRRVLMRILPGWWLDRIDLENASIRRAVTAFAGRVGSGERILDAGSGQCRFRQLFAGATYVGVDFGRGEKQWDYSGLDAVGRLENLPFPDGCFDDVICTQVLEHLAEPELVLRELARVTRSGGRMLLTAPLGFGEHQVPHDYYRYTSYGLNYLLRKAGWTVTNIEPRGGYFRYMAVMMIWTYLYFFPESRPFWLKVLLSPLQIAAALAIIVVGVPIVQSLDRLDHERCITLGFSAECIRNSDPKGV
ncbi:class I SAM-dependent methyltransferase [bacterium]|nr:class I SAM-dependent methyltransferase [candidate division CSSED10-310 bacterium]